MEDILRLHLPFISKTSHLIWHFLCQMALNQLIYPKILLYIFFFQKDQISHSWTRQEKSHFNNWSIFRHIKSPQFSNMFSKKKKIKILLKKKNPQTYWNIEITWIRRLPIYIWLLFIIYSWVIERTLIHLEYWFFFKKI